MSLNLPFVMEFVVYLTNRCNLRCEMCSQYGDNFKEFAGKELSFEEWKPFFDSLSDVTPKPKIILMGGEPLLYKEFDKILEYLNNNDFSIHIVTNGVFLDKHKEAISKCKNITITVSIDGLENTHDSIRRVKGTFKKAINNIALFEKERKNNFNLKIFINSVLLPDNIKESANFLEFIQTQSIDQIVFQHLQFLTQEQNEKANKEWQARLNGHFANNFITNKQYLINKDYINELKASINSLSDVCRKETFIFPYLDDNEINKYYLGKDLETIRPNYRCTTPWLTAFISPEGNVSNCIENTIGNITEENFWDIWNNEKASFFRQNLCEDGNFSVCSRCCNFYKSNFLYAKNAKVKVRGKEINLPSELNFIKPAPNGVFILDKTKSTEYDLCAIPQEIHSQEMLEDIKKHHTILGFFSEIEN